MFTCSRSSAMQEMSDFVRKLKLPGLNSVSLQHWYPRMWDEWAKDVDHVELCSVEAGEEKEESLIDNGYIRFKEVAPKFADGYRGNNKPNWMNVVRFKDYYRQFDFSSVLPRGLKNICTVLGEAGLNHIWISTEGINVPCNYFESDHLWIAPKNIKIFEAWFKERGLEIQLSSSGKLALKIIKSVRGLNGIRTIQNEEIISLLNRMSHNAIEVELDTPLELSSKSKVRAKTMPIKKWRELLTKINHNSSEVADRHLQNLINCKILKCGIYIQCPECMQHTWYSLNDLSDRIVCERCLETFDFPVLRPIPESAWHFRTFGPFSVENYVQGGYCTALSLRFFGGHSFFNEMSWIPSFNILNKKTSPIEADFGIFLSKGRFDEVKPPDIIFGECKSYNEFTNKDVNRMKQLAVSFPGSILAFCTLRTHLKDREKKIISKLAMRGRRHYKGEQWINPVLILTGIELFSEYAPPTCWNDKGDPYNRYDRTYKMFDDIQDLCDASQQIHLGIESYSVWLMAKMNKKNRKSTSLAQPKIADSRQIVGKQFASCSLPVKLRRVN